MKTINNHLLDLKVRPKTSQSSTSELREYAHTCFDRNMERIVDWIGLNLASSFLEQQQVPLMFSYIVVLINEEFQRSFKKLSLEKIEIEPEKNLYQYLQEISGVIYDFIYQYFDVEALDFDKAKSLSDWSFFFEQKYRAKHETDAISRFQVKMSSLRSVQAHCNEIDQADISIINDFQRKEYAKAQFTNQKKEQAKQVVFQNRSLRSCKDIDQQHQKNLANNINHSIVPFLHNINHHSALSPQQVQEIQKIARLPYEQFVNNAAKCLNQADLYKIIVLISNLNERQGKRMGHSHQTKLAKNNHFFYGKFTSAILASLNLIIPIKGSKINLFYHTLKEQNLYSPPAKRFLMGVLEMIEGCSLIKNKIHLRAALRIFENRDISPSELADNIARTKPARCKEFVMSQQSYVKNETGNFIPAYVVHAETIKIINEIHRSIKYPANPPTLQFVKLNHNSRCKTITITISGFLSQFSDKDEEWMQLIHALRSSEIYSLRWKSSSISTLAGYVGKLILSLPFFPLSLPMNPFAQAWTEAEVAGVYLAEILMSHFADRFVNLVGFSLGTRVIQYCLIHLLKHKKTNIINRVVTMGGVANSRQVYSLLSKTRYPLQWVNLWSERDYIVRYMLKLWDSSCCPIGAEDIRAVDGHVVVNVNLTSQVPGHLDFKNHHYCFGKMLDIYHD